MRDVLRGSGMTDEQIGRVAFLVEHHHSFTGVDGPDWQILLEADFLANAAESGYSRGKIENFLRRVCKTESGARLIRTVFCLTAEEWERSGSEEKERGDEDGGD